MTIEEIRKIKKGFTHSGIFHADDVFSTAFLKIIEPDIKIERGYVIPDNYEGIIYDIGRGEFDHHQVNNTSRDNGIPYASFGKLWKCFAPSLYGNFIYKNIDRKLIWDLDLNDNTGTNSSLAMAISLFNPLDNSNGDKEFFEAVDFAYNILNKIILKEKSNEIDCKIVKDFYDKSVNKKIIVLDKRYQFMDYLIESEAVYVIYPDKRGGYAVRAIPKCFDSNELKVAFPKDWLVNMPDYIKFCHNSLFLISSNTLEEAIKAAEMSLKRHIKD